MSSSEEDSYSMIFASLKHPIRRKILRVLSSEPSTFSDLLKQFKIESSHLTYHIDGLGNLLYKTEDSKYALSSLGEAAVSMMKNVEEPPNKSHFPFIHLGSSTNEKKLVSKAVPIALGIICIILTAVLLGAFAYYVPLLNSKNSTISSLNSQVSNLQNQTTSDSATMANLQKQIDFLQSQITELEKNASSDNETITNLKDQLNLLTNWSLSIEDLILNNPSDWVNKTVIVEGTEIAILAFPPYESSPYFMQLDFGSESIGLVLTPSLEATIWTNKTLWIYGVVRQGENIYSSWTDLPSEVTYYIEAQAIEPLSSYASTITSLYLQISQLQAWLDGNETLLNQTQAQINDLVYTLNLHELEVWIDNRTISQSASSYTHFYFNPYYAGYVSVNVTTSTTNTTYVEEIYSSNMYHIDYNMTITVGTGGTATFPVLPMPLFEIGGPLPNDMEIRVGNTNTVDNATETLTITFHY